MDQQSPAQPGSSVPVPVPVPGDAVTLRRFELADVDAMMEWASDPEVVTASTPWNSHTSRDALLAFLRDAAAVLPQHPWFRAICLADVPEPVGAVSVTRTDDACRFELCVVVARAHWGKGVGTAAARRAVAAAFAEVPGVERVEAVVDVGHAAARRVLEKAGFRLEAVLRSYCVVEGRIRDMAVYSVISTDPHPLVE